MSDALSPQRTMQVVLAVAAVTGLYAFFGGIAVGMALSDHGVFRLSGNPLPTTWIQVLLIVGLIALTLAVIEEVADALAIIRRGVEDRHVSDGGES